jgi:hypothetical protein
LFLVRLIPDLHQPLHVGDNDDRGGNSLHVLFGSRGTDLHHLWDSLMMEQWSPDEDRWLAELAIDTRWNRMTAAHGTVEQSATESLVAARRARLDQVTGEWIMPGAALGEAYFAMNLPLVGRRLYQSGARLTWVLNEAFSER